MRTVIIVALVLSTGAVQATNDWPQAGYNETHQSAVPSNLNTEFGPFTLRWWNNVSLSASPGSPSLLENVVYFGDRAGNLNAIDRESGGKLWSVSTGTGNAIEGAPAAGGNAVHALNNKGQLHAFDRKTGAKVDGYPINVGSASTGTVLYHSLQNLLIATAGSTVKAYFANTREEKWWFSASGLFVGPNATAGIQCQGGTVEGTPVVFEDYVFFGSTNKCFFALDNRAAGQITGTGAGSNAPVWVFLAENSIRSSPAIDIVNRRVLFGDQSGNLYAMAVGQSGKVTSATMKYTEGFSHGLSPEFKGSPAVFGGRAIVASRNGNVHALSLTSLSTKLWSRPLGQEIVGTPAIANGRILVGTIGGNSPSMMYMLNFTDGAILDQRSASDKITVSPIISGSQGIWASDDGALISWGGTKPPRADLAVTSFSAFLLKGQPGSIEFQVRNSGVLDAGATSLALYVGGTLFREYQVPALNVGGTYSNTASYTATAAGPLQLRVVADSGRVVPESDEANNEKILAYEVADPPPPPPPKTDEGTPGLGLLGLLAALAMAATLRANAKRRK